MTKREWEWMSCFFDIKRSWKNKDEYFNLKPKAVLTIDNMQLKSNLNIKEAKFFNFQKNIGFCWHKSWNLPLIKLNLDIFNHKTQEFFNPPNNIYAEITVVKPILSNFKRFHLQDIGIQGINKIKLISQKCIFSSLKFQTTSYNHNEAKFHLLITVYIEDESKRIPMLIDSKISPPIFVDSRKSARDQSKIKIKQLKSIINIFEPKNFDKKFIKKETKSDDIFQEEILNDCKGLFNYFTAANIRDKVKHPLFLSIQFSKCIKLYYNSDAIRFEKKTELIQEIQKNLYNFYLNLDQQYEAGQQNSDQKLFILNFVQIEEEEKALKINKYVEALEVLKSNIFLINVDNQDIPDSFIEL